MGDWGYEPWANDEAADWFHVFWKGKDFSKLIDEIENFDPRTERYEELRAACYLLQTLGRVFVWPAEHDEKLKPLLTKAISILEKMIDPPDDDWGFLDSWVNSPGVIKEVESQIEALKARLSELA